MYVSPYLRGVVRTAFFLLFALYTAQPCAGQWDQYFASWEGKPGSVILDMSWGDLAPIPELPFLVHTTLSFPAVCRSDGFPEASYQVVLDNLSEEIVMAMSTLDGTELVGHFLHNCEKRDYFYTYDTVHVLQLFDTLQSKISLLGRPKITVLHDPEWKVYRNFLYPDPLLKESMANSRGVKELIDADINLKKAVLIHHEASFNTDKSRDRFRTFLLEQGFKIASIYRQKDIYLIRFSRKNTPDLKTMNEITIRLNFEAQSRGGQYNGWSVEIN